MGGGTMRASYRARNLRQAIDHRGRSSGFRIVLLAAPSRDSVAVAYAAFVPGYSGGTATDLHRFPYSFRPATSRRNTSRQGEIVSQLCAASSHWLSVRRYTRPFWQRRLNQFQRKATVLIVKG
jgi:hypothetical protein